MTKHISSARKAACNTIGGVLLGYAAIMLVASIISSLVVMGILMISSGLRGESVSMEQLLYSDTVSQSGIGYILSCFLITLMIRLWKGRGYLPGAMKKTGSMSLPAFLGILSVFMCAQLAASFIGSYTESVLNHWGLTSMVAQQQASGQSTTMSMFLYVSIFAPIVEELMFRGAVMDTLMSFGKRFAMISSALLFGLFHGNVIQIPFAFLVGLVLSYVRAEYGLGWCMLLHFINNCIFVELQTIFPEIGSIILLVFLVGALITLTIRGNRLRHYIKSIPPTEKQAYRDLLVNPLTILLLGYCLYSTLTTITPI